MESIKQEIIQFISAHAADIVVLMAEFDQYGKPGDMSVEAKATRQVSVNIWIQIMHKRIIVKNLQMMAFNELFLTLIPDCPYYSVFTRIARTILRLFEIPIIRPICIWHIRIFFWLSVWF